MRIKERMKKIIFALILLLVSSPAFAAAAHDPAALLQKRYDSIHDMRADFTQVSVVKAMNMTKKASGVLIIKKPGMLRYTYTKPEKEEIIVKGGNLIMYVKSTNQVITKKLSRAFMDKTPTTFLAGMGNIGDSFDVIVPAGSKGRPDFELIPKGNKMGVEKIYINMDPKGPYIRQFTFVETSGDVNTITLSRVKINRGVKDSAFDFKIPKGASLISE